jgi:hypothetical protein
MSYQEKGWEERWSDQFGTLRADQRHFISQEIQSAEGRGNLAGYDLGVEAGTKVGAAQERERIIAVSEKIEEECEPSVEEWRGFKALRSYLRDNLTHREK